MKSSGAGTVTGWRNDRPLSRRRRVVHPGRFGLGNSLYRARIARAQGKEQQMKLYDKVMHKGDQEFIGTVVEIHTGKLDGMVSVAWPGGRACESVRDLVSANA